MYYIQSECIIIILNLTLKTAFKVKFKRCTHQCVYTLQSLLK